MATTGDVMSIVFGKTMAKIDKGLEDSIGMLAASVIGVCVCESLGSEVDGDSARIHCYVSALFWTLKKSSATGLGVTGTEPVSPPNMSGVDIIAAEATDCASFAEDVETSVSVKK